MQPIFPFVLPGSEKLQSLFISMEHVVIKISYRSVIHCLEGDIYSSYSIFFLPLTISALIWIDSRS